MLRVSQDGTCDAEYHAGEMLEDDSSPVHSPLREQRCRSGIADEIYFCGHNSHHYSFAKSEALKFIVNVLIGSAGGWILAWGTAYVLIDIHFVPAFAVYFSGCYFVLCVLFMILASSHSSPLNLRTFMAGVGLMTGVVCLLLQKSLRHFFHTREVGLRWTPLVRDIFDSLAGAVVSMSCLFCIWAIALFSTRCCVQGGVQWPFGAQVLLAALVAALIGIGAGLEFGHNLQKHADLKSGTMALVMSKAMAWQILSVSFGLLGMVFAVQVIPRWHPRVPIDAEVSLLAEEFGPASFLRVVFAATSAPVASVFGRVRMVLFPSAAPDDSADVDESELIRFQAYR